MDWKTLVPRFFRGEAETTQADAMTQTQAPMPAQEAEPQREIVNVSLRPILDVSPAQSQVSQYPTWWARYDEYEKFSKTSDVLGIVFNARKSEIFRRGIAIKDAQGDEETGLPTADLVPKSIVEKVHEENKRNALQSFIDQANANDQSLTEVLKELEDDECTFDDAYLACQFEYEIDGEGRVTAKFAKEFFRLHPAMVRMMVDRKNRFGRLPDGTQIYFSVYDREKYYTQQDYDRFGGKDPVHRVQLFPAWYEFNAAGSTNATNKKYYAPWEVKHASEFSPSLTYSTCPNLQRIWMKVWTLVKMDQYVMQNYALQRPPKFFLVFNTTNATSLEKEYQKMLLRAKSDPHIPQILANESKEQAGGVQVVDLMRSLEEMQFIDVRQEYRQQIGALYGVMPVWQADISTSGGLNNEGMQITVTNRAIENAQKFYNEKFLRFITRSIGVTDLVLELNPSEELDEVAVLQRQMMKIQNANAMRQMGFTIHFDQKTGEFSYSGQAKEYQPPMMPGAEQGSNPFSKGPDNGFQSKSKPDGTSEEETKQADFWNNVHETLKGGGTGFPYPGGARETQQSDKDPKQLQRAQISVSEKLLKELEPELRRLEQLAKSDPAAVQREIEVLALRLADRIKNRTETDLRRVYVQGMSGIEAEFNLPKTFSNAEEAHLANLLGNPVYQQGMTDITNQFRMAAYKMLTERLQAQGNFSLSAVKAAVAELGDVTEAAANVVARTETNRFFQAGRRQGYKRAEAEFGVPFLYDYVGPDDHRTTQCCAEVKEEIARKGGAVPWDVLVEIVQRKSRQYFPTFQVEPEAPTAHWQCRHFAIRKVV